MLLIIDRCRSHESVAKPLNIYNSKQYKQALDFESCQHGFRSQRSCEPQLVQFYHDMVSNLDGARDRGQKQTDVIIVDFAKAFDKVPHGTLLCKLDHYGIRGSTDVGQLMALWALSKSGVGWSSLRSSPGPIWCPSRFGLRPNPFFSSSLMIFRIISGHLFASLRVIVCFIGVIPH